MSNEKRAPGWLGYIGDYTTQLYGDYNQPLSGSLLTNQDSMESERFFFSWLMFFGSCDWFCETSQGHMAMSFESKRGTGCVGGVFWGPKIMEDMEILLMLSCTN